MGFILCPESFSRSSLNHQLKYIKDNLLIKLFSEFFIIERQFLLENSIIGLRKKQKRIAQSRAEIVHMIENISSGG